MRNFVVYLIPLCLMVTAVQNQVLKATVKLNYDHLPNEEQRELEPFKYTIEDYINGYAWTEDEYETDIVINIMLSIETVHKKGHERMYKSQFQISSSSGERFYDKIWEFPYQQGIFLEHDKSQFDPVSHFLDYYAYLILGGELDTYDVFLGSPFYEKALEIVNRGMLSNYSRGWKERLNYLQHIRDSRIRSLREIKPDLFEAIYLLKEGNKAESKKYAVKTFNGIEKAYKLQPNNKYLKQFFDAHYRTLADLYRGDQTILNKLSLYDSLHKEMYRSAMQ
jgi:hypothetical protein